MSILNKVTLKLLKRNKTRTLVTIIGIILSAAMITGVTSLISSAQNYVINLTIADEGDWHAAVHGVKFSDVEVVKNKEEIREAAAAKSAGYAVLEDSANEHKPYLYILEMDKGAFEMLPVHLMSGRLPQNENELLISNHIFTNDGPAFQIGDTVTLDIGYRISEDGAVLGQKDSYVIKEDGESEKLVVTDTRTFTIVGMCSRLSYTLEGYSAPGHTVITVLNTDKMTDEDNLSIYFKAKKPSKIYSIKDKFKDISYSYIQYNNALLRYMGISDNSNFNSVLYSLGAILIVLIMVGSISLIYNSFSISVSERKKQFGLLSGTGATSKQLRRSVLFEAFVLSLVGIPLGVLSGILGIYVTLYFIDDLLASMVSSNVPVPLTLSVSVLSVIIAVLVALVTILISAWIPARGAAKVSALDAIRQTHDIKLTTRQVRTWRLTRRLFGIEGDIALKNIKRNRRRYRSTVVSLFISIVLFVSASAFTMYLKDSIVNVYEDEKYDLAYFTGESGTLSDDVINAYKNILALDSVNEGSIVRMGYGQITLSKDQVSEAYYEESVSRGFIEDGDNISTWVEVTCVDHDTFSSYITELGLDENQFAKTDSTIGIVVDSQHFYDYEMKKYRNTKIFAGKKPEILSMEYSYREGGNGNIDIQVAAVVDKAPFGVKDYANGNGFILIVDESMREAAFPENFEWNPVFMYFSAEDPSEAQDDIEKILSEARLNETGFLYNVDERLQESRNFITITSVFSYGFIVLISLIATANIFNTISTNVNLRRREFAMLKSVGMTDKSFNKMINYECVFYGLKALLYGLPVSVLITYLIYSSVNEGVDMAFKLPVQGMLISVLSVFMVVFASMIYSMNKIKKENILDALVNENL